MSIHLDADYRLKHRAATSKAMKRNAKNRQCPSCKRKAAMTTNRAGGFIVKVCRWCGFEKGGYY